MMTELPRFIPQAELQWNISMIKNTTGILELLSVELLHCCVLIGRELHALNVKGPIIGALSDATPALLCHKEPAFQSPLLGALERKIPPTRGILLAPRWFFMS